MATDTGLATLLDLDGSIIAQEHGCWVKIEAWAVPASREMPHGIRYSLTLHDRHGKRMLGYDNAHALKPPRKGFSGTRLEYDHRPGMPVTRACPTRSGAPINCSPTSSPRSTPF